MALRYSNEFKVTSALADTYFINELPYFFWVHTIILLFKNSDPLYYIFGRYSYIHLLFRHLYQ